MYLPCVGKNSKPNGKRGLKVLFNASVYIKFRVCFTFVKYENDMLTLCETSYVFIDIFVVLQNSFISVRTV